MQPTESAMRQVPGPRKHEYNNLDTDGKIGQAFESKNLKDIAVTM